MPAGRSVVTPRSACPDCGTEIRNRDNIPILSWIVLRGRCRDCGSPISARYPIVEAVTAGLFVATPLVVGVSWTLPAYLWFVGVCVTLTITDLDHQRIPNRILGPGLAVALVLLAIGAGFEGEWDAYLRGIGGAAAYFGVMFILAVVARGGLGFGDVKLAALLGLFLGYESWRLVAVGGALAVLIGGLIAVALLIARRRGRKDAIAFGPSMVAGAFLALVVGDRIATWYLGG